MNKRGFIGALILITLILILVGGTFIYFKLKAAVSSLPLSPFKKEKKEAESEPSQINYKTNISQPTIEEINVPENINLSYNNSFKGWNPSSAMENEDKRLTMALISGASHAIKYKEKNPRATEDEIIQHITKEAKDILEKIDE